MSTHDTDPPDDDIHGLDALDELDARFATFRTLPTPAAIPVDQLRAPRRRPSPRWLAAAAAVVALTLISVALLAAGRDDPDELTTTAPPVTAAPSSSTSAPGTTRPEPPTTIPPTTATVTSLVPTPTTSSVPTTGPPTTPPTIPPTTSAVREPIPPPTSIPPGAPIPDGQWPVKFSVVDPQPTEGSTTIGVKVSYARCAGTELPGPRLHDPVVTETDDAVVITFWADALGPPDEAFTCPAVTFTTDSPPDYIVTLAAPLGTRWVYDGRPYLDAPPFLALDPNVREP